MSDVPETRYAHIGESSIAYQVVGDGPIDIINIAAFVRNSAMVWDIPSHARYLTRLASFSRLIMFDRRGQGLSDPIDLDNMSLEQWMEDVRAVMDAVGSERAALLAAADGGQTGIVFAATYPERTSALILVNAAATLMRLPDYPWGLPSSAQDKVVDTWHRSYWDDEAAEVAYSGISRDDRYWKEILQAMRSSMPPLVAKRLMRYQMETDVRHVLPTIRVPTLVIHHSGALLRRVDHGRYLAENIDGAKFVELPGREAFVWGEEQTATLDEIQEFLTGVRPVPEANRVLATVLTYSLTSSPRPSTRAGWEIESGRTCSTNTISP